jgi:16S rRNA G966 N2-methylase RsmD
MVRKNIEMCRAEEYAHVTHGSFLKTLQNIDGKVDIFLLDPPYKKGTLEEAMKAIAEMDLLAEDGVIVAEHGSDKDLPEELYGFHKVKEKRYGIVVISIYM